LLTLGMCTPSANTFYRIKAGLEVAEETAGETRGAVRLTRRTKHFQRSMIWPSEQRTVAPPPPRRKRRHHASLVESLMVNAREFCEWSHG
jgi:hypothetical protein